MGVAALTVVLLYRKIESVAKLMVALWVGVILTIAVVLVCGLPHFNARVAFDFPPGAFSFSRGFLLGLGSAMMLAMYDYLGYYSICYIGDEVRSPSRTMPRSILISVFVVAAIYLLMNVSIISVVPWREALKSEYIASEFMERLHGPWWGALMTVLVCWTAFASVFTLTLAYSRIPYAAARDGFFFSAFARLHPRGDFPHVSLLVLGAVAMGASFFSLDAVISVFVTSRILVQFLAQIAAVARLRSQGARNLGFRMMLYPLPSSDCLGWLELHLRHVRPRLHSGRRGNARGGHRGVCRMVAMRPKILMTVTKFSSNEVRFMKRQPSVALVPGIIREDNVRVLFAGRTTDEHRKIGGQGSLGEHFYLYGSF